MSYTAAEAATLEAIVDEELARAKPALDRMFYAERWPLPGHDPLPEHEIAIAIRTYEALPQLCLIEGDTPAPTLAAWLAWCDHCWKEFGAVPSGT